MKNLIKKLNWEYVALVLGVLIFAKFHHFGLFLPFFMGKTTTSTSSSTHSTSSSSSSSVSSSSSSVSSSSSSISSSTSSSTVAISWNNYLFVTGQGSFGERIRGKTFGE